jgi:hypothetical protein
VPQEQKKREEKAEDKVSDVRCPTVNHGGGDVFVQFKCIVQPELSNPPRGPTTPCARFADFIHRYNDAKGVRNPPPVTLETQPRIGDRDCDLIGHSYELPVILAYLMAKHRLPNKRTIIATGRLLVTSGVVGNVDAFERKMALLLEAAPHGSLFIYPKGNVAKDNTAIPDMLQRLKKERGVKCIPIGKLDDVKFLWKTRGALFIKVAAGFLASLAIGLFWLWVTSWTLNPILNRVDESDKPLEKSINTASRDGTYHALLCPLLLVVLSNANLQGRKCTISHGSPDNIDRARQNPANISYVQDDVWLRTASEQADVEKKLFPIHEEIVCEGLWMVTKNPQLTSYDQILKSAPDITFILPPKDSGPAWTFSYLRTKDRELSRASKFENEGSPAAVLDKVARSSSEDKVVGFFVLFPTPDNANIKRMVELVEQGRLRIIPLDRKEITYITERGLIPYRAQTFNLKSSGILKSAMTVSTACVKVGLITGRPETFSGERERKAQNELIDAVKKDGNKLKPREGTFSDYVEIAKERLPRWITNAGR